MNPRDGMPGCWLSGRVMQWFSSRPPSSSLLAQEPEVGRVVGHPDVLGEADRRHRVEPALGHVAVVAVPDLAAVVEPLARHPLGSPARLLLGERDADRRDAVVQDGVTHHASPATADVEQPHTRPQLELAADQVELLVLGLLEGRVEGRVDRTGVGHRRAEQQLVEPVRHVVVVMDRLGVADPPVGEATSETAQLARGLLLGDLVDLRPVDAEEAGQLGQLPEGRACSGPGCPRCTAGRRRGCPRRSARGRGPPAGMRGRDRACSVR